MTSPWRKAAPHSARLACSRSVLATISAMDHRRLVTPAAIAGVTRRVWCARETRVPLPAIDGFFIALDALGDLADGQSVGEQLGGLFDADTGEV